MNKSAGSGAPLALMVRAIDEPGALHALTRVILDHQANITYVDIAERREDGSTVYFEGTTKRSGTIPVPDPLYPVTGPVTYKEATFYEDNLTFTQDTIDDLVGLAKSARTQVALAKNLLPWLSIGIGIVLVLVGVFLALKARRSVPPGTEKAPSISQPC